MSDQVQYTEAQRREALSRVYSLLISLAQSKAASSKKETDQSGPRVPPAQTEVQLAGGAA